MFRNKYTRMTLTEKRKLYKCGDSYVRLANIPVWPVLYRKVKGPPPAAPRKERTQHSSREEREESTNEETDVKETTQETTLPSVAPVQEEVDANKNELGEIDVVPTRLSRDKIEVNNEINYKVSLWNGDITTLEIDAIIRGTDITLKEKLGAHAGVHKSAGPTLMKDVMSLNGCEIGDAKITSGHKLPAKYIIHTVGPFFGKDKQNLLSSCYENCLDLILEYNIRSVAFPCVSTGLYGYPNREAAEIALRTTRRWLLRHGEKIERIVFCTFLSRDFQIYQRLMTNKYFPCECINKERYLKPSIQSEDNNDNEPGKPDGEKFGNTQSNGKKTLKQIFSHGGNREKSGAKEINGKMGKSVNGEKRHRRGLVKSSLSKSLSKSMVNLSQMSMSDDSNSKTVSKTDDYIGKRSCSHHKHGFAMRRPKSELRLNRVPETYTNESSNLDELMSQINSSSSRASSSSSRRKGSERNGTVGENYTSNNGSRVSNRPKGDINVSSDGGVPKLDELMSQINSSSSRGSSNSGGVNGEVHGTAGGEMRTFDGLESKVNYTPSRGSRENTKGQINGTSDGGISKLDEVMSQINSSSSRGSSDSSGVNGKVDGTPDGEVETKVNYHSSRELRENSDVRLEVKGTPYGGTSELDDTGSKTNYTSSRGSKENNYLKGEINIISGGGVPKLDELMSQISRESSETNAITGEINIFSDGEICNAADKINYSSSRGSSEVCDTKGTTNGTSYSEIYRTDDSESKANYTSNNGLKEDGDIKNQVNASFSEIPKVDELTPRTSSASGRNAVEILSIEDEIKAVYGEMSTLDFPGSKISDTPTDWSRENSSIKSDTDVTSNDGLRKLDELESKINSTYSRGTTEDSSVKGETNDTSQGGLDELGDHKTNDTSNHISSDVQGNVVVKAINDSYVDPMDKPNVTDSKTNTTSTIESSESNAIESNIIAIDTPAAIVCKVNDASTPKAGEDGDAKIKISSTIDAVESNINNSSTDAPIDNVNIPDKTNSVADIEIDNIPHTSAGSDTKSEISSITSSYHSYSSGNDINTSSSSNKSRFGYCGSSSYTSSFSDRYGLGSSSASSISSKLEDRTWERVGASTGVVDRFDSYTSRYQHSSKIRAIIDKYSDSYKI